MNAVFTVLTIFVIIAAILLIVVVLLQNGKGEGLASNFVAGNQTFGVRQTADLLEKITWGLVAFILVASIVSSYTLGSGSREVDVTEKITNTVAGQPSEADFPAVPAATETPAETGEQE